MRTDWLKLSRAPRKLGLNCCGHLALYPLTTHVEAHFCMGQAKAPRLWAVFTCWLLLSGCAANEQTLTATDAQTIIQKSEQSGVELLVEVSPKQPRLSDMVDLIITVTHPRSIEVEPPIFGQSVGDFAVRDYRQQEVSDGADQSPSAPVQLVIRYQLEPMFSGRHLIRSIPVAFSARNSGAALNAESDDESRDIVQSEPIEIEVVSEFGKSPPDLSQVTPMFEPLEIGGNRTIWMVAVVLILLLIALVVWFVRWRSLKQMALPALSPEEVAQAALSQLIAEQLPSRGLVKEFYLRLTGIVRVYIEEKTGLKAPEQTTEEFLRDMRSSHFFDGAQSNRLQEFLVAADLVKYAGQRPDEANIQQSVDRAKEFVTMQFNTLAADAGETSTNGHSQAPARTKALRNRDLQESA